MLKPLSSAIADNDTIRAVVRASAVAQDGKTPGITLASRDAQASLLRSTYRKAGLEMAQTGFFEAHGTGTVAGDAAELGAIGDAFGPSRPIDQPLLVGSVKTNVGHLEGTASLAGIIKAILSVEKGVIPRNLNFERPNPDNDLEKYRISVPTQLMQWPLHGARRASVNCFGFGGTIAHVILDDIASFASENKLSARHVTVFPFESHLNGHSNIDTSMSGYVEFGKNSLALPYRLLALSAPEQDGVQRNAEILAKHLSKISLPSDSFQGNSPLDDFCYTLNLRRTHFQWRSIAVDQSQLGMSHCLSTLPRANKIIEDCKVCFVFTGQGAQWPMMGRELARYPAFNSSLKAADAFLRILGAQWSIEAELNEPQESSRIDEAEVSQVACTVLQCALVDLLKTWGVSPASCVGHSSGEIAATYAAGAISRESAWKLAYHRGKASTEAPTGRMLAVGLSPTEVKQNITRLNHSGTLELACFNGSKNTTVSGDSMSIEALHVALDKLQVFNRVLKVDCAYHSTLMKNAAGIYANSLAGLQINKDNEGHAQFFSSVTGSKFHTSGFGAAYFVNNLTSPVRFEQAVTAASEAAQTDFVLEIGPHSALRGAVRQIMEAALGVVPPYASMLTRGENACKSAIEAVGKLWTHGVSVDLATVNETDFIELPQCLPDLPPYSFNHSRSYWWESSHMKAHRFRKHPRLDLLGAPDPTSTNLSMRWRGFLRPKEMPWLVDHQVQNTILYPGAGMIVMALEAARQISETAEVVGFELTDVRIMRAMVVPVSRGGLETYLSLKPRGDTKDTYGFSIKSRSGDAPWQENCNGTLRIRRSDAVRRSINDEVDATKASLQCTTVRSPRSLYELFENQGMKWGPAFQNVIAIALSNDGKSLSTIKVPDIKSLLPAQHEQPHVIHPATLDALFQSMVFALPSGSSQKVPTSIDYVFVDAAISRAAGEEFSAVASMQDFGLRAVKGSSTMHHPGSKKTMVIVDGLVCSAIDNSQDAGDQDLQEMICSQAIWKEDAGLLSDGFFQSSSELSSSVTIGRYINLAGFKNPDLELLELGLNSFEFTETIFDTLVQPEGSIPRVKRYVRTGEAFSALEQFAPTIEQKAFDFGTSLEEQEFFPASFDIVITSDSVIERQGFKQTLQQIHRLLKPNGKLVIAKDHCPPLTSGTVQETIQNGSSNGHQSNSIEAETGRHGFDLGLATSVIPAVELPVQSVLFATRQALKVKQPIKDILLLRETNGGSIVRSVGVIAKMVSEALEKPVITLSLEEAISRGVKDCIVISLLGLSTFGVQDWTEFDLTAMKHILSENQKLLWITEGGQVESANPGAASIMGVLRALRYEDSRLKPYAIDLSAGLLQNDTDLAAQLIIRLLEKMLYDEVYDQEYEFAERDGKILIPRMVPEDSLNDAVVTEKLQTELSLFSSSGPLQCEFLTPGNFDSLCFRPAPWAMDLPDAEVEITAAAWGVHPLDAMAMSGETDNLNFGYSAAGTITAVGNQSTNATVGDRVVFLQPGSLRNVSRVRAENLHVIPQGMPFSHAVGLTFEFATAQYALLQVARIERGESCLIEDPLSPLGQAALFFAKHQGADAFILVENSKSRQALSEKHGLPANRVLGKEMFSSKGGLGTTKWDVIFCDMTSSHVKNLWHCLADFGRLVQVLPKSLIKRPNLERMPMHSNATLVTVDLDSVRKHRPRAFRQATAEALALISRESANLAGLVVEMPLTSLNTAYRQVYEDRERANAIALVAKETDLVPIIAEDPNPLSSALHEEATYIIVGGLGGLGRSIAKLLVDNGAKYLVFLSRSGGRTQEAQDFLNALTQSGAASATAMACDVADANQLTLTLSSLAKTHPPIKGAIQAAMVLHDALFENMTHSDWLASLRPKIQGSHNLHTHLPPSLDFLVLLSSIAGEGGMRGQTNYAAGNAYQDALARHRRARGLPAVCIDVTAVLGVGVVAENPELIAGLKAAGVLSIQEAQLHRLLKAAITGHSSGGQRTPSQIITGVATGAYLQRNAIQDPIWQHDARFTHTLKHGLSPTSPSPSSSPEETSLPLLLRSAPTLASATSALTHALATKLARALGVPVEDIDASRPVSAHGVDSLVAVELRNWIQRRAGAAVSVFELMGAESVRGLAGRVVGRSGFLREGLRVRVGKESGGGQEQGMEG